MSNRALIPFPSRNNEDSQPLGIKDISEAPFAEAARMWLSTRKFHLAPRTSDGYGRYIEILARHFGRTKLSEITGDQIRAYQRKRMVTAGPHTINKECGVLVQMRKRIGMPLMDYQRLPMAKDYESPGRALTAAEETKLEEIFKKAADHPTWKTAALASLLSMKCGAGPGEIKSLRLKDVSLNPPQIVIPRSGAKRVHRERRVPLEGAAVFALEKLLLRATNECKCSMPEHYLIPRRNNDHSYDPTKPAQGWRSGLDHLLGIAEIEIRSYDFRHHAVSRALSDPRVSAEAAKAYFGWISPKMFGVYYHADGNALKTVASAIDGARAERLTQALCNQDVLAMLAGGLEADIVIETIRGCYCGFDVSCQTLLQLKQSAVPPAVIKEMVKRIANRLVRDDCLEPGNDAFS